MEIQHLLSILAGVFVMAGYVPYIAAVLKRETVPSKASWLIWAAMDSILLYGMFRRQAVNGQILGTVLVIWIVVVLSFGYGRSGWTLLDKSCLSAALVATVLVFVNPTWSIVLLSIMSFIGALPTFRSAWEDPSRENRLTWMLFWISCMLAVLAVPKWTVSAGAQPVSFLIVQTTMVYLLFGRRSRGVVSSRTLTADNPLKHQGD